MRSCAASQGKTGLDNSDCIKQQRGVTGADFIAELVLLAAAQDLG